MNRLYLLVLASVTLGTPTHGIAQVEANALARPVQPVFGLPLASEAQCIQGNNGAGQVLGVVRHDDALRRFALDFGDNGAPVVAAADGVAYPYGGCAPCASTDQFCTACNAGFGNHVKISHGSNIFSMYAHLSTISMTAPKLVRRGDVIGTIGRTGDARISNLHFAVHLGNPKGKEEFGASIGIENLVSIDQQASNLVGVRAFTGSEFQCGRAGHIYSAVSVETCDHFTPADPVPPLFGAVYNPFTQEREALVSATCTPEERVVTVGSNREGMSVYKFLVVWRSDQWEYVQLQCVGEDADANYCEGQGIARINNSDGLFAGFVCQLINGVQRCGCVDAQCQQDMRWSLQGVSDGGPISVNSLPEPSM